MESSSCDLTAAHREAWPDLSEPCVCVILCVWQWEMASGGGDAVCERDHRSRVTASHGPNGFKRFKVDRFYWLTWHHTCTWTNLEQQGCCCEWAQWMCPTWVWVLTLPSFMFIPRQGDNWCHITSVNWVAKTYVGWQYLILFMETISYSLNRNTVIIIG